MSRFKKLFSAVTVGFLALGLAACGGGGSDSTADSDSGSSKDGQVYFMNFKPEQEDAYKKVAKAYEKETGTKVKVVTAASGKYETQLKSEMAKSDAPTIFQINGQNGYKTWKDYCLDLSDSELYKHLNDQSIAISDGDGVYGVPLAIEGYGIIYNLDIMQKYFDMDGAVVTSIDEINNFDTLKKVTEDMTAKKDKLGIDGVFANTSLAAGEEWRWQTHLSNVPFYYEFKDRDIDWNDTSKTGDLKFTYADNFKNLFDLYLDNSTTEKNLLGSKTVNDSMAEFALGKSAMVQNGNWAWSQISEEDGNVVKADKIGFLPLYTGMDDDESQGICIGTENFFCINSKASKADQKASLDFLTWLYTSDNGKKFVTEDLGFIAPFDTFTEEDRPADPLGKAVMEWDSNDKVTNVPWAFTCYPSQYFKDNFGANLLQYAQGSMKWKDVVKHTTDDWASEYKNSSDQ